MNSPALLAEIAAQLATRRPGARAHVINLTLFPMTPDDHRVLEAALPVGPVAIMSRGFGNCRVTSTGARDVWRVQYFNNMNTLILNTHRNRRPAGGRARRRGGPRRQPRAAGRARRVDERVRAPA